ncbi:hypothetical protein SAMN04487913_11470 [Arthrobacter sp. ok362]|nr:hypothetical protein SAMN04487913_11470 [Arthrobacter sp. ok362]
MTIPSRYDVKPTIQDDTETVLAAKKYLLEKVMSSSSSEEARDWAEAFAYISGTSKV